jgi:sugar/nucleoside kinase (ribokinase family)
MSASASAPAPDFDAVCVGLNVVDVLVRLPAVVTRGAKHETSGLVLTGGGPASNAACVLAALGARTGFVGRFGSDTLSLVARAEFTRYGVREDFFLADPAARPAVATVEIDPAGGERTIFYNVADYPWLRAGDISADLGRRARLILCDGYDVGGAETALLAARAGGAHRVLDLENGEPAALLRLLALGTDAIIPLHAARVLSGAETSTEVLRALAALTPAQLVVTDGARGCWALTSDGVHHQPGFPVAAVDTTGCGDSFHGAYAFALLQGWSLPLRLEFAAWVASRVALGLGGRGPHLPTRSSLIASDHSVFSLSLQTALRAIPSSPCKNP